ncbi:MAG TPA: polysaccharide deacetylase family protein [Dissulfurispiraceae bacterium]|nr:polysaccharide deacetylase family protein [Dissulfurispiraceae bacterium]
MACFLKIAVLLTIIGMLSISAFAEQRHGIAAFSFDDGYPNWMTAANILKKHGGVATGYVNNYRIDRGDITAEMLRTLQDGYGWEIGTHTYGHANAEAFVLLYGREKWMQEELLLSLRGLAALGLKAHSLVFPYNKSTEQLRRDVLAHVSSFRVNDERSIGAGIRPDGSFPGKALDVAAYIPLSQVLAWIDRVHREGSVLFLYGHQVLPDAEFQIGSVQSVDGGELTSTEPVKPFTDPYICLVPDMEKGLRHGISIQKIEGNRILTAKADLSRLTAPGVRFMIGPCMGLRESDLEAIVTYAASRLEFRRMSDLPKDQ